MNSIPFYNLLSGLEHSPDNPLIGFSVTWNAKMASDLSLFAYSSREVDIAKAVAQLCKIDEEIFKKKIKPYFNGD